MKLGEIFVSLVNALLTATGEDARVVLRLLRIALEEARLFGKPPRRRQVSS